MHSVRHCLQILYIIFLYHTRGRYIIETFTTNKEQFREKKHYYRLLMTLRCPLLSDEADRVNPSSISKWSLRHLFFRTLLPTINHTAAAAESCTVILYTYIIFIIIIILVYLWLSGDRAHAVLRYIIYFINAPVLLFIYYSSLFYFSILPHHFIYRVIHLSRTNNFSRMILSELVFYFTRNLFVFF